MYFPVFFLTLPGAVPDASTLAAQINTIARTPLRLALLLIHTHYWPCVTGVHFVVSRVFQSSQPNAARLLVCNVSSRDVDSFWQQRLKQVDACQRDKPAANDGVEQCRPGPVQSENLVLVTLS